tara:strand:- start:1122 stop:1271 length:150 start_codon:yes stop_codon:yes gene_type:complete
MKIFGGIIFLILISCEKPEDYCEELYKEYYYNFETKQAMVLSMKECYSY